MQKPTDKPVKLLPCPFCGSENLADKKFGISCRKCGVWMGAGGLADSYGGYKETWNMRGGRNE